MTQQHQIDEISVTGRQLHLKVDGKELLLQLDQLTDKLAQATDAELANYDLSPGGYGIHWPMIDEDLSIDGLLGIEHHKRQSA
jgi:hypothetical protein